MKLNKKTFPKLQKQMKLNKKTFPKLQKLWKSSLLKLDSDFQKKKIQKKKDNNYEQNHL